MRHFWGAVVGAAIGAIGAFKNSRDQRKAAQAQADAASQPRFFNERYGVDPANQPLLDEYFQRIMQASNSPLPKFPEFQGFSYDPQSLSIGSFDYEQLPLPHIAGPGASRDMLREIKELYGDTSIIDEGAEILELLRTGQGNRFIPLAEAALTRGTLAQAAAGNLPGDPFEDEVIRGIQEDARRDLELDLGQLESRAAGVGRTSSPELFARMASDAREASDRAVSRETGALRSQNFAREQGLALGAAGEQASGLGNLASLRSGDLRSAASLAPALEQARFIGPGIASDLSVNIDQLAQARSMFLGDFAANQHGLDAYYDRLAVEDRLAEALFGQREQQFAAGINQANALAGNEFNLARFGFEAEAPFLRLNQLSDLLLPALSLSGFREGQNQQYVAPAYTPSPWASALLGGLGGAATGQQIGNLFGNGGGSFGGAGASSSWG